MSTETTIILPSPTRSWKPHWSSWLLFVALFYVVVGLRPFTKSSVLDVSGGDSTNQMVWGVMALLSLGVAARNFDEARDLLRRSWPMLLALGWFAATVLWAPYSDLSIRRVGILFTVAIVGMGLALTCKNPVAYFRTMVLFSGVVMTLNIFGLLALPGVSIVGDAVVGMHSHKNTAGQAALVAYIIWFVAAVTTRDYRWRLVFAGGTVAWLGFLVLTHSKTSLGIALVLPIVMAAAYAVTRAQGLVRLCLVAFLIAGLALVWSLFLSLGLTVERLMLLAFQDLTFTGRTNLWEYLWGEVANQPLLGFGYGSFWHTGLRLSPINFATGWSAVAGQAHNGYLDIILQTGYIGLGFVLLCILRAFYLAVRLAGNPHVSGEELGAYLLGVALFTAFALLNLMESSYFRGFHYLSVQFFFLYFFVEQWSDRVRRRTEAVPDAD